MRVLENARRKGLQTERGVRGYRRPYVLVRVVCTREQGEAQATQDQRNAVRLYR